MSKRNFFIFVLAVLFANFAYSQIVTMDTVLLVAKQAHSSFSEKPIDNIKIADIVPMSKDTADIGYIINFDDNSFVIVPGEYAIPPVLGKCPSNSFSRETVNPGLKFIIEKYKAEIMYVRNNNIKASNDQLSLWKNYAEGKRLEAITKATAVVSDLSVTKWAQYETWNLECPDENSVRALVGCTGVAVAQLLRYWDCRVDPEGSVSYNCSPYGTISANFGQSTYNWSSMSPDSPDSNNRLILFHAGASLETKYGEHSSSVFDVYNVDDALEDYWGFKTSTDFRWRVGHPFTWKDDIKENLDDGVIVQYNGGDFSALSGHSWLITGYDDEDKFWCNWGAHGSNDGWFSLGGFNIGGSSYNTLESAVFDAVPVKNEGVGTPLLENETVYPGTTTISCTTAEDATAYYWTTSNGTITSPTTSPSTTLNTTVNTEVCVRSFNSLCSIYSEWDCENFDVKLATPSWSDTKTPLCNNSSYTTRYDAVPYATSYYVEASGGFLVWNWDNYNWQTSTTTSYTYVIVKAPSSGSGAGTISVTAKRSGAVSSDEGVFDIWHGIPPKPTTYPAETGIFQMGLSETESFHVTYGPHADSYLWTINGSIMATSPTTNPFVYVEGVSLGYGGWTCKSINECGQSTAASGVVEVISAKGAQQLSISPNPASEEIFISILNKDGNTLTKSASVEMDNEDALFTIFNCTGSKVFTGILESENARVIVADWPAGIYFLVYNLEGETLQKSFIVEE